MCRSPEALAFGSRRHFMPASLSLPLIGCLVNRSRDCTRSRVPPSLHSGGAMLTLLRVPLFLRTSAFAAAQTPFFRNRAVAYPAHTYAKSAFSQNALPERWGTVHSGDMGYRMGPFARRTICPGRSVTLWTNGWSSLPACCTERRWRLDVGSVSPARPAKRSLMAITAAIWKR